MLPHASLFLLRGRRRIDRKPPDFAFRGQVRLKLHGGYILAALTADLTLVQREKASALARERAEEPQQVFFMEQPELQVRQRFLQHELAGIELGRIRIGLLRADVVFHAKDLRIVVRDAKAVEPVDALLFSDEARLRELLSDARATR